MPHHGTSEGEKQRGQEAISPNQKKSPHQGACKKSDAVAPHVGNQGDRRIFMREKQKG